MADPLGEPLTGANKRNRPFSAILRRAGLPETFRVDNLHGSSITLNLLAGVPWQTVSEHAGHSSVAITGDVQAHLLPAVGEDACRRLTAVLDGARKWLRESPPHPQKRPKRRDSGASWYRVRDSNP